MSSPEQKSTKKVTIHNKISTFKRLGEFLGVESKKIKEEIEKSTENLKTLLKESFGNDFEKHSDFLDIIEGRIPKEALKNIDFNKKESINKASDKALTTMLKNANEVNEKLKETNTKDALTKFISIRIFLNLKNSASLDDINKAENLKKLKTNGEFLFGLADKATDEYMDAAKPDSSKKRKKHIFTNEQLETLKEKGQELQPGLYATMTENGSPFFVITDFNNDNINQIVDKQLKESPVIHWSNIQPPKQKKYAEIKCLQNWKRATFDGAPSDLSKHIPEEPGSYSQWIKNVRKNKTKIFDKKLEQKIIQDVVGNDEKRLQNLWKDVVKNRDKAGFPQPDDIFKKLRPAQQKQLQDAQKNRINDLLVKLEKPGNTEEEKLQEARSKKQLEKIMDEYAQVLYTQNKDIANTIPENLDSKLKDKIYNITEKEHVKKIKKLKKNKDEKGLNKEIKKYRDVLNKRYPGTIAQVINSVLKNTGLDKEIKDKIKETQQPAVRPVN